MFIAIFVSIICHILCLSSLELTFAKRCDLGSSESSEVLFLGPILPEEIYSLNSEVSYSPDKLYSRTFTPLAIQGIKDKAGRFPVVFDSAISTKPYLYNFMDSKIVYLNTTPILKTKGADSSIMFYPQMPYHFLLYFKDRQTAHVEVAFYVSSQGKIMGLKRKISSGNPEVDLLIMRHLAHFLNIYEFNFTPDSWRVVKIDLSP